MGVIQVHPVKHPKKMSLTKYQIWRWRGAEGKRWRQFNEISLEFFFKGIGGFRAKESISYARPFQFGLDNEIFRYWSITVYRFRITTLYINIIYLN